MGKKIISYSLWGNTPMYTIGAIRNAELAETIYPGWICRFYVGDDVEEDIVNKLKSFDNTEVIIMEDTIPDWQKTIWRFNAITNEGVDFVILRDTDSRLTTREYNAVIEWINSGKYFHIMRDHPYHTEAILAGMWGCKPKELMDRINEEIYSKFDEEASNFSKVVGDWLISQDVNIKNKEWNHLKPEQLVTKGIDQILLRSLIYPIVCSEAHIQDSFPQYNIWSGRFDYQYNTRIVKEVNTGFPSRRGTNNDNFVGQVFDENDIPVKEYSELLMQRDKCIYMDWATE